MSAVPASSATQSRLQELESLTRSYARYSRSAGGLGSVLGGILCLMSYLAGGLLPLTPVVRIGLTATPFVWLLAKGWLAHHYYQRFGHVEEQVPHSVRRTYQFCIAVSAVVALLVTVGVLSDVLSGTGPIPEGVIGYLLLVWLLPVAAWRWLRSPLDFIIGVFLICQAALACVGRAYPLLGLAHTGAAVKMSLIAAMFPLAALAMIVIGWREHRRFRKLRVRLDQMRNEATQG